MKSIMTPKSQCQSSSNKKYRKIKFKEPNNFLLNTIKKVENQTKEDKNSKAFIIYDPIRQSNSAIFNSSMEDAFNKYLQGLINEQDLLYVKSFPLWYSKLPSPRQDYLKLLREKQIENPNNEFDNQQQSPQQKNDQNARKSVMMQVPNISSQSKKSEEQSLKERIQNKILQSHLQKRAKEVMDKLRQKIKTNLSLRKFQNMNNEKLASGGFIGNIEGINEQQDQDIKIAQFDKSNFITKAFKNLTIVHEKKENNSTAHFEMKQGVGNEHEILKTLYKNYIKFNVDEYLKNLNEPFHPNYRTMIINSEMEYNNLIKNYLDKPKLAQEAQEARKKNITLSKLKNYINGGICNYGFRKYQGNKERIFIKQLSDIDLFNSKHMVTALKKFEDGEEQQIHTKNSRQQRQKFAIQQCKLKKSAESLKTLLNSNTLSNFQKKMVQQKQDGYFVIKRNQNQKAFVDAQTQGIIRDDSDDSSNASRTEAALEHFYQGSIDIQNKLKQKSGGNQNGLISKLKKMMKLEDIKKNIIECNSYKLEHR